MVIWDIFPVFYVGKSQIHEHFCLCTFSRAKPATEAQLGPQLRLSHLALTALQLPQCAETNICWPTLKPTALKFFGLTANNKQKTPKETKIEPQCKKFGRNQLTISPLQQKCTKNSFICTVSSAHRYTATSRFPGAIKKGGKPSCAEGMKRQEEVGRSLSNQLGCQRKLPSVLSRAVLLMPV